MMIGVDNLANINLKHGRHYGDEVIRRCAEVFEKEFPSIEYGMWKIIVLRCTLMLTMKMK